jgi:hypothetical protein
VESWSSKSWRASSSDTSPLLLKLANHAGDILSRMGAVGKASADAAAAVFARGDGDNAVFTRVLRILVLHNLT